MEPKRFSVERRALRRSAGSLAVATLMVAAAVAGTARAWDRQHAREASSAVAGAMEQLTSSVAAELETDGPLWDLPNIDHPRIDYWVRRFTTDKRGEFEKFLSRSGRYVPMISEKLAARGMPQDLIYLAMIESGFNPSAYSHAHASGLWQFIAETGQRYGLTVNRVVDERNDPVRSTDAALDYLTYLHHRFGSWYLAAAGYNTGENRVGRIMRQVTGSERGRDEDFYRIWDRLPRETRDYVPLMIAAARLSKEAAKYGFDNVELEAPLAFEVVMVEPGSTLEAVAGAARVEPREVRRLNPHLKTGRTPTNRSFAVRIPPGTQRSFVTNWPQVRSQQRALAQATPAPPATRPASTRRYQVRAGDNLTSIARRHGVTVAALRSTNGLRSDRIRAGQSLTIPAASRARVTAARQARPASSYRVRPGDNLTRIASRHGVSVSALRSANGIRGDRIRAGETLRIPTR